MPHTIRRGSKIIGIILPFYYVIEAAAMLLICILQHDSDWIRSSTLGAVVIASVIVLLIVSIAMIVVSVFLIKELDNPTFVKIWLIVDMICIVV